MKTNETRPLQFIDTGHAFGWTKQDAAMFQQLPHDYPNVPGKQARAVALVALLIAVICAVILWGGL